VPETRNLDQLLLMTDAINDTVGFKNDFADVRFTHFWHAPPKFRKRAQSAGFGDEFAAELLRPQRVVKGNVADNLP